MYVLIAGIRQRRPKAITRICLDGWRDTLLQPEGNKPCGTAGANRPPPARREPLPQLRPTTKATMGGEITNFTNVGDVPERRGGSHTLRRPIFAVRQQQGRLVGQRSTDLDVSAINGNDLQPTW